MNVLMARSKIKAESVAEVETAIEKFFSVIKQAQPAGVRYAVSRLADGVTFVVLLEFEGGDNPLAALPAFVEFQEDLKKWIAEPPTAEQMTVIGSYRLF
jgi:hypothetical protein